MIVFLRGEGSVEVFINGVSFGLTILRTANSTSVVIPVSYAVPGKNVELNNAPFLRLNEGVASEIQAEPSKYHSPADAFGSDDFYSVYWETRSYPAELTFTFDALHRHVADGSRD